MRPLRRQLIFVTSALALGCATLAAAQTATDIRVPVRQDLVPPVLTGVLTTPYLDVPTHPSITEMLKMRPGEPMSRQALLAALAMYAPTKAALDARSQRPGGNPNYMRMFPPPLTPGETPKPDLTQGVTLTVSHPLIEGDGWLAGLYLYGAYLTGGDEELQKFQRDGIVPMIATQPGQTLLHLQLRLPGTGATRSPYVLTIGMVSDTPGVLPIDDLALDFRNLEGQIYTVPLGHLPDLTGFVALIDSPPGDGWMFLKVKRPVRVRFSYLQVFKI